MSTERSLACSPAAGVGEHPFKCLKCSNQLGYCQDCECWKCTKCNEHYGLKDPKPLEKELVEGLEAAQPGHYYDRLPSEAAVVDVPMQESSDYFMNWKPASEKTIRGQRKDTAST